MSVRESVRDWLSNVFEEPVAILLMYLIVCGGAANIFTVWWIIRWCTEHLRVV